MRATSVEEIEIIIVRGGRKQTSKRERETESTDEV